MKIWTSGIINDDTSTRAGTGGFSNWNSGRSINGATGSLEIQADANFFGGTSINQSSVVKSFGAGGAARTDITAQLQNTGSISLDQGTMRVTTPFDNQGTVSTQAETAFEVTSTSFTNSGTLRGNGTVRTAVGDDLVNNGTIAPGLSTGLLTVDGDLRFGSASTLQIELAGLGDFDQLLITDDASFGGTLEVVNLGYVPTFGDSFVIVRFDQRLSLGEFSSLSLVGWGPDVAFTVTYNANEVMLTAVPEPGTWVLWLAGLAAVSGIAKRRRSS